MDDARERNGRFLPDQHDHGDCVAAALEDAKAVCVERGVRLTPVRQRVLEIVWQGHRPLGAYAILEVLSGEGHSPAPPTVYRALEFLLTQGLARISRQDHGLRRVQAPARQERAEKRSGDYGRGSRRSGRAPGRDPSGGAVRPTGCVEPLARCPRIARRGSPALSAGQRRAGHGPGGKCGLVHRLSSLNAFVGCSHPGHRGAGQFLLCTACGSAAELNDPGIERAIERGAAAEGFVSNEHTVEIGGVCPNCREA